MIRSFIVAAATAACLLGCGTTRTNAVVTGDAEAPNAGTVRIIMAGAETPQGFREIALVQARGMNSHADMPHVIEGLKKEARRLGCTVIIRVRVDQGTNQASATGVCGVLP